MTASCVKCECELTICPFLKKLSILLNPQLYKTRFKQRKEMRSFKPSRHPCHIPPIYPLHPLPTPPVPLPLYPPGIIGGEYDQRPGFPHGLLPRPRYDPIGPLPGQDPGFGLPIGRRSMRPSGNRPADIRRGFI